MTYKELHSIPQEAPVLKTPYPTGTEVESVKTFPSFIAVWPPKQLPQNLLEYFKMDPRTQHPLSEREKVLHVQVYLHEIEEGARLLAQVEHQKEAEILADFSNQLHPNQRLELLRKYLQNAQLLKTSPERVSKSNKIRHNQWGAFKTRLSHHPALAFTEIGIGYKERNEDALIVMPNQKILAVADGMGGHHGGDIASGIAIDFFEYGIQRGMEIEQAMAYANDAILIRAKSDPTLGGMHAMGCTFAAVQLKHSLLRVAHIGDTKVLVIREGEVLFETTDHTKGQALLREGLVDEATAFELNHILNRSLGLDRIQIQRDLGLTRVPLEPGDRVLLMTDGITDNFFDKHFSLNSIAQLMSNGSLAQAADSLVDACHQRLTSVKLPSGRAPKPDNISLAMMEYRG